MADEIYSPVKRLIESRLQTQWDIVGGGVPIEWEGVQFTAPDPAIYIRSTIRFASSIPLTIARYRTERQPGMVYVNVFAPKDGGTKAVDEMVDKVAKIFRWYRIHSNGVSLSFKTPEFPAINIEDFITGTMMIEFDSRITIDTQ